MTNEEWDRKIEFLLNQQAKFDAGMQELEEGLVQLTDMTGELINTMSAGFRSVFESMKQSSHKIDVLVNSQMYDDERIRESYKRMKDSEKRLAGTDKTLQNLTTKYERHIRKYHRGRNGVDN